MDVYHHVFYQIEPRQAFADWLVGRVSPNIVEILVKPFTYHSQEKEDATWLESDRLLKVKLLFLVTLCYTRFSPFTEREFAALFGSKHLSESLFDQWWTIRRYQATQSLGEPERLLQFTKEPAAPTGSAKVDKWLADVRTESRKSFLGSVLFHRPSELEISPLVHGVWPRPLLELLVESGAAGGLGGDPFDSCAHFIAWCLSKDRQPTMSVHHIAGAPLPDTDSVPYEWYDEVMAKVASWDNPPLLVDLDEYVITTHLRDVLWPPDKRRQKRPKDPRSILAGSPFPWGWYGQDLGDFRPGDCTYNCYPPDSLPPILVPLNGTFRWLRSARKDLRVLAGDNPFKENLSRLLAENPVGLPREFIKFFRSRTLWRKIRSCTDCYFALDSASTAIPGGLGRLVRFLSDSQDCKHWHIHISPCGTKHTVVATYHFAGNRGTDLQGGKPHPRDITTCAASFEEFIYRFWLENELWFALNRGDVMPANGGRYLAHYLATQVISEELPR